MPTTKAQETTGIILSAERPAIRKRSLLYRVSWEWDAYDDIKRKVTAKALMNDEENPLLLAIKVSSSRTFPFSENVCISFMTEK